MDELSVLIGGKAGFGIDRASLVLAKIISQLGYRLYVYRDYPSLIRGGHTFSIIRASREKVSAYKDRIDVLIALDQETFDTHKGRLQEGAVIIYDASSVTPDALPLRSKAIMLPLATILKEEKAGEIMRNSCAIGAFAKAFSIDWDLVERVFWKDFAEEAELNLKVAKRGLAAAEACATLELLDKEKLPLLSGNEATALGLIKGGVQAYISYPMTPTSPILHYMARMADEFALKVIHPENEIAVMLMALGMAYCGQRVAVGTSGGGFCLMTEGLSLSGMAELPVVIVLGQRPGPSTGLPTYSCQTELFFAMSAGQGEFLRFIAAPGDTEEAYSLSRMALEVSWKYQIPSILLTDKVLGEGTYSFDVELSKEPKEQQEMLWDRTGSYKRYQDTDMGISPMAFAPDREAVIKVNSYEHDEYGITTENAGLTEKMQNKRLRKEDYIDIDLEYCECVRIYGDKNSKTALVCWGSNKGVCIEVGNKLGLKVIQPLILMPFPVKQFKRALEGTEKMVCVESNATGQLAKLISRYGIKTNNSILKYDGRPFSVEELTEKVQEVAG
jgi:2-oxoglutarate ferredoxin oxidoreductase subunit alpha